MRDMGFLAIVPVCGARERDIDTGHTPSMGLSGAVAHGDNSIPNSQQRQESKVPKTNAVKSAQYLASMAVLALDPQSPPSAESVTGDDTKAQGGYGILPGFHSQGEEGSHRACSRDIHPVTR